jgi:radical SAM superfamily enzyme YgiQ (UPF0313 family)
VQVSSRSGSNDPASWLRFDILAVRAWLRANGAVMERLSRRVCHGFYDGRNLASHRRTHGATPVLFAIPPMSDVNGALPHPGVRVLQTILRHDGVGCEVINYNLPVNHPRDSFDHLIRAIGELGVEILGVSTYSQAIRNTLDGLKRVKAAHPHLKLVLGGPHPTESYLSLMGVSFIDYVCRGEAEESFPALVRELLAGRAPAPGSIPGVYQYDRATETVSGVPASFIELDGFDSKQLLRYHFSSDEFKQMRLYRGCHGTAGAKYWPVALVRGCPYDCSFCAAYQMSGKKLRYRKVEHVVDDLEFYLREYGRRHFSFIDDAFTEHYEYVAELCREIERRGLQIYWTTDNGIRYETLGRGKRLDKYMKNTGIETVDELIDLMVRAGWRGTAVGIESGSLRVRRDLVRKGGVQLSNEEIIDNLQNVKRVARRRRVYFYVNGFMMAGFFRLPLKHGKTVAAETAEEMEATRRFTMAMRDQGAIDMMNLSMVIPLPGTDTWDCLDIREKLRVLLGRVPGDHPEAPALESIRQRVLERFGDDLDATRYTEAPEAEFWREVYRLSDEAQVLVMQSFDAFNADEAHTIDLGRPSQEALWHYRESVVTEFYAGFRMKLRMLKHVVLRSRSLQDISAYLTLMARKYDPAGKHRPGADDARRSVNEPLPGAVSTAPR